MDLNEQSIEMIQLTLSNTMDKILADYGEALMLQVDNTSMAPMIEKIILDALANNVQNRILSYARVFPRDQRYGKYRSMLQHFKDRMEANRFKTKKFFDDLEKKEHKECTQQA